MTYQMTEEEHIGLHHNSIFDSMGYTKKKPPLLVGGSRKKPDPAESDIGHLHSLNIADKSDLYKQNDLSMSENSFIKLNRSETTDWLMKNHPNAFLLLTQIALRARRYEGHVDGKEIGEAEIGDFRNAGIESEKKYRNAKLTLERLGLIEIVSTKHYRNNLVGRSLFEKNSQNAQKGAIKRAIKSTPNGTVVKLLSSSVYDVNIDDTNNLNGDQKGDQGAIKGRSKGDKQEYKETNKVIVVGAVALEKKEEVVLTEKEFTKDDIYHCCVKFKKDWTSQEMEEVWEEFKKAKNVKWPMKWIEAVINKKRDSKTVREKNLCDSKIKKNSKEPSKNSNKKISEPDTSERLLANYHAEAKRKGEFWAI